MVPDDRFHGRRGFSAVRIGRSGIGPPAQAVLRIDHEALTFDDVLLRGHSEVIPRGVSL